MRYPVTDHGVEPDKKEQQTEALQKIFDRGNVLTYHADKPEWLQSGDRLRELTFDNVRFTGLGRSSLVCGSPEEPLEIRLKNVTAEFEGGEGSLFHPDSAHIRVTES